MVKFFRKIRIGLLHATYHRNMKKAVIARKQANVVKFKKYIYRAEDAWRRMVTLIEKQKK